MDYESCIRQRKEENRKILRQLGIFSSYQESVPVSKSVEISKAEKKTRARNSKPYSLTPSRRSGRLLGKEPAKYSDIEDIEENLSEVKKVQHRPEKIRRENVFGAIPGVAVGTEFSTRIEASHAGIHRPTVAGIHGNPALGCYSIALSGGYEDDVDRGDSFIYTGEGGRDLKGTKANPKNLRTAPQSKDQVLERGNLALSKNVEYNRPVRVLRGYKLRSEFAPSEGYRYDGLYRVVNYYVSRGLSGFGVYKFQMERIEDQEPAPWSKEFLLKESSDNVSSPVKECVPIPDDTSSPEKENIKI